MCEATVFLLRRDGSEELVMEDVDEVLFEDDGQGRLVSIFGNQLSLRAHVKSMSLANHRVMLAEE